MFFAKSKVLWFTISTVQFDFPDLPGLVRDNCGDIVIQGVRLQVDPFYFGIIIINEIT